MADQAGAGIASTLDVSAFLGGLRITPFHRRLILLSCLVTFFDGLDFALVTFTIPFIRDAMHLSNAMMGYVSSAAFLGQMLGSLGGSYIADVIGRRPVIVVCTALGALLTFSTGFASSPETLILLRLLSGLAIGGLLAPVWSINIEAMPRNLRATSVTIIMLGFSLGTATAGQVTNLLAPGYGWEGVFFFCGATTFGLAFLLLFTLPESARWMVAKGKPLRKVMPLLDRFAPGLAGQGYTSLSLSDEQQPAGDMPWTKFIALFKGPLAILTPIIWVTFFFSSFAIYLKSSFGLLFLEKLGIPIATGINLGSIGGLIGAVGGVLLLGLTEKRGPIWLALAPLLGVPLVLLIGSGLLLGGPLFIPVILLGTIMIGVSHAGVISVTSIYYPSAVRSTGGGWASFMAKFAAVAAPIIGSQLFLADRDSVLDGYLFTGLCLSGALIGILMLAYFARALTPARPAPSGESAIV